MAINAVGKTRRKRAQPEVVTGRADQALFAGKAASEQVLPAGKAANTFVFMMASCVLAGAAVTLSFAPFGLFPLAWIGVAVLFVSWERCTSRQAALLGFMFGAGLFSTGGYWLYTGLMRHGGYSMLIAVAGTGAVVVVCAAHVALAGVARVFCADPSRRLLRLLVVMPSAWVVAEWLRTWSLTGWLSLGYGQIDGPLAGYAPIGGVQLVSFASAIIAGALALAWLERRWIAPVAVIAVTLVTAWPLRSVEWTSPHGRTLEVAAVQGNVSSDIKWTPGQLQPTLDLYAKATLAAMQTRKLDAVIWPETAITARPDQVAAFLTGLQQATRSTGTTVILGIIDVERGGTVPMYFNAALVTGAGDGAYRKRHLVPLTEYIPTFLPTTWQEEKKREAIAIFSPGADVQPLIRIGDVAVATTICYETSYGALIRDPEGKPQLLLSLTNDDWFMGTTMPAQDHQVVRMRALEAGREMLRVANSGITAWIGANGHVLSELRVQERATLFARMQPRNGLTPYWRWGEWVWVVAMLMTGASAFAASLISRRNRYTSAAE